MNQMTTPKGHATLGGDAVGLTAQPGDCAHEEQEKTSTSCSKVTQKAILQRQFYQLLVLMIHSKFDQQI